jgi:protein TonB
MTSEMRGLDEFDVLLNDVLRTVANPEMPERMRVQVQTRVWVREMKVFPSQKQNAGGPNSSVVFAPEEFLAQMQPKRDARSTAVAMLLHAAAIALIFWMTAMHVQFAAPAKTVTTVDLATPPKLDLDKDRMGGGGGQRGPAAVSKGRLPDFAKVQITPPMAPPMEQPKIHMPDPTIEVQTNLKMANNNMPNLGDPNSPLLGNSMGNGRGTGIGSGGGSGIGPGWGGNVGGGIMHVGGGVSAPVPIYEVEPEFSEEARKAKFMGVVTVNLIVDRKGMPENVHILRGVGMGLDEKAIEAVKQYRFKPAMLGGKPVAVEVNVEVDFKIF